MWENGKTENLCQKYVDLYKEYCCMEKMDYSPHILNRKEKNMVNTETTEEFVKELDLTEEEIESYTGCSERTQRCLTDCPWPFPGAYINEAS